MDGFVAVCFAADGGWCACVCFREVGGAGSETGVTKRQQNTVGNEERVV
jgi:hypothetical protein